jgi:hypothetical protein
LDALKPLEEEEKFDQLVAKKFNQLLDQDDLSLEVFEQCLRSDNIN